MAPCLRVYLVETSDSRFIENWCGLGFARLVTADQEISRPANRKIGLLFPERVGGGRKHGIREREGLYQGRTRISPGTWGTTALASQASKREPNLNFVLP